MRRRTLLKQCTAGLATMSVAGIAGCSGSDDSSDSDDQQSEAPAGEQMEPGDTATETSAASEQMGSIGENTVEGLEIVSFERTSSEDEFTVSVTVRNTGEQTTDIFEYEYPLTLYDDSGADITGSGSGSSSTTDTEVEPGEQASLNVFQSVDGDPADVAEFEIGLSCEGMFVEGVYCE